MGVQYEDDFQVPKNKLPKVPTFQHLLNSIILVTGRVDFIKGFKFDISFPLSEYFNFSHSWNIPNTGTQQDGNVHNSAMPTLTKPTYTFTTQLVKDVKSMHQHPGIVMLSKVDSDGKLDAIFLKKINENLSLRAQGSFPSSDVEKGVLALDLEVQSQHSQSIFKVGSGHFSFNCMQRVHKNLILGFDYTHLLSQKISLFSYGAKAFIKKHSFYAQYMAMSDQLNLAYMIPIKKGTMFVSQWRYAPQRPIHKSTTIIGFKQKYQQSEILATINSRGKIATILSLKGPTYGLKLCALIDYMRDKYTFGYGITIGQQH